ncbi:MAG: Uma2 family endonuclease [Verrucomicrobiaceae bacterium]|nr:Uma2 family endonuclease [Verrucomicrobiaceae bacterium]
MTALLEVPAIRQRAARLSVEDYHRLGELPVELLRGNIIEKMPKSPSHQFHADRLRKMLSAQLSPDWVVRQEGPLTFADSEPEPDVAVVRGPEERYRSVHPSAAELVIEVAISSLEIDRVKAHIYAEAGVKEYWIVCPEERQVEVFRQPGASGYSERTMLTSPTMLECASLPGVRVDFAKLFA